jgi:Ca2+-binding EF-hand superfamily protein
MPVGAVGAIVGARMARQRKEGRRHYSAPAMGSIAEIERSIAEAQHLKTIMVKYDADHSGKLDKDELSQLLMDWDFSRKIPELPSEDELNFIISVADKMHANDGCIDLGHLKPALQEWTGYLKMREPLVTAFHEHDVSRTGKLEPPELKEYLQKVNGNKKVSDEEVDWVLSKADLSGDGACSCPSELYLATKSWSKHKKERENKEQCCVVM